MHVRMTRPAASTLVVCLILFCCSTPLVYSDIATVLTVDAIIKSLRLTIGEVIGDLDSSIDKRSFDMRTHLLVILQNLEYAATTMGDHSFDRISQQQQELLRDTQTILAQVKSDNLEQIDALSKLSDSIAIALSVLPTTSRVPFVKEYGPSYLQMHKSRSFVVSVEGLWIGGGDSTLNFPNGACKRIVNIDNILKFDCSVSVLGTTDGELKSVSGDLMVYGGISGREDQKHHYEVSITTVPNVMGALEISAIVDVIKTETIDRSSTYSWRNGNCQGRRNPCGTFNQTNAEWKIAVGSISNACSHSSKSSCLGIRNLTESSFQVCAVVQNNGSCGPFWHDARGHVWGKVSWKETRVYTEQQIERVDSGDLEWGVAQSILLPIDTAAFQVKVRQLDGATVIADHTGDWGWFGVSKDVSTGQLIIRPKELDEVF